MRRSLSKKQYIPPPSSREAIFRRPGLIRLTEPKSIWKRHQGTGRWFPVLVMAFVFVLTLFALSHASPPLSRGARPIALGNGYAGVSGDVYSLFYNPAGLYEITQQDISYDYGRSDSAHESPRSDFNVTYATPYRFRDKNYPVGIGLYTDLPAKGAHIVDITAGTAGDAPLEQWTKGLLKFPAKVGLAATLRQQSGDEKSPRVGKSSLGLGLTGGFLFPINRDNQVGVVLRDLFNPGANPPGPLLQIGVFRRQNALLNLFGDLEFGSGGVWRLHPGVEFMFARGVLRPRIGWGFRDNDQIDSIATGIGFYVSPLQVDTAYLIPIKTANDESGQFRVSLSYRFGRPQFSEIYYDRALEQASQLDQNVVLLTAREAELKASLDELEQKKRLAKEELENAKSRIEALKNQDLLGQRDATIRDLKGRIQNLEGNLSTERGELKAIRQKQSSIRIHTVKPGDTLQSLAREYYGDPNLWKKIYNANPDKIDRGLPKQGSKLMIP